MHLGRYIVGYTAGKSLFMVHSGLAVKLNFKPYIRQNASQNENFEYSYPLKSTPGFIQAGLSKIQGLFKDF